MPLSISAMLDSELRALNTLGKCSIAVLHLEALFQVQSGVKVMIMLEPGHGCLCRSDDKDEAEEGL